MARHRPAHPFRLPRPPASEAAVAYGDDLDYLEEELGRLALMVLARNIRRSPSPKEGAVPWAPVSGEAREALGRAATDLSRAERRCAARLAATRASGLIEPRLEALVERVGLAPLERDVLLYLCGAHLGAGEGCFERVPEVDDMLAVLAPELRERVAARRHFYRDSALVREGLVEVETGRWGIGRADVLVDPRMLDHLLGLDTEASALQDGTHLYAPRVRLADVILPEPVKRRVVDAVEHFDAFRRARASFGLDERLPYGRGLVVLFHGPPGTGKTMLANAIAAHMGKRLLLVNEGPGFFRSGEEVLRFVLREARLRDAVVFFDEAEAFFGRRDTALLTEVERHEGLVILATNRPEELEEAMRRRITLAVRFDEPGPAERQRLWEGLLPVGRTAAGVDPAALAERYRLPGGHIKNAVLAAVAAAAARAEREGTEPVVTGDDLEWAAGMQIRGRLLAAGSRCVAPRGGLDRLVLSPALERQLREVLALERARPTLLRDWGFGAPPDEAGRPLYGGGTACLFYGPPGTGKTAAAEALAYELCRPLHLVTAADVLDKYVGETAKRLQQAFEEARAEGAVLLLDEADALLGARTTVRSGTDRLANADVNVLLGLIERHDGLAVLTTNLAGELDGALRRRLALCLQFDAPDAALRARLWRSLIPPSCPVADDIEPDRLAAAYALTGAGIERAVYRAAARAASRPDSMQRVSQEDLMAAAAEEAETLEVRRPLGFSAAA